MRVSSRTLHIILLLLAGWSVADAQQFNLLIEGIPNPPSPITTRDTVPVGALVINVGPQQSTPFSVGFRVTDSQGALVFSDTVNALQMPPNPSGGALINASRRWHPTAPGNYLVRAALVNVEDMDSLDNVQLKTVNVVPGLLSRADAIALVERDVITGRPNADRLLLYLHNLVATDSLLRPNTIVRPWDSSWVVQVPAPAYLLWIDNEPSQFWCHSATFCFVNATTGELQVREAQSWPVIDEVEHPPLTFGPNRVRGAEPRPAPNLDTYTPVTTTNKNDWALIVVGQNQAGWDSTALINDVVRIKECLNGATTGPQVTGENIRTVGLGTQVGATKQEVCDAIDSLKGQPPCNKLYVYYVGHGSNSGMGLRRGNGNGSESMSWHDFACKLIEANPNEVCVVMMACSSGASVDDFVGKKMGDRKSGYKRLKGTVVTSAPPGIPTTGTPSGSPFHRAMTACCKDPAADLNGDGKVSLIEAMNWAREKNDTVRRDNAGATVFGDGRGRTIPTPTSTDIRSPGDGGGSLKVEVTKVYYGVNLGDRSNHDTLRCRRFVYFTNSSGSPRRPNKNIEVVCVRQVKQGRRVVQQEEVLVSRRMTLGAKERFCYGPVPDDCGIVVRTAQSTRRDDDDRVLLALDPPGIAWPYSYGAVYNPGEFIFGDFVVEVDSNHRYRTEVDGPSGWGLAVTPATLQPHGTFDQQMIFLIGQVPDTATQGALLTALLIDTDNDDTVRYSVRALLYDSLDVALSAGDDYNGRALDQYGDAIITGGTATLNNSILRLNGDAAVRVATDGHLVMRNSVIGPDSGSTATLDIAGMIDWENSSLTESADGLRLLNPSGTIEGGAISVSDGNGLAGRGDFSGLRVGFIHIEDVAGVGMAFDSATGVLVVGSTIAGTGTSDVAMRGSSVATLRDCQFNPSRVLLDATSMLTREWTTHFVTVDSADNPIAGVIVEIRDIDGNVVALDTTDADGFTKTHYLVEWTQTGPPRTPRGPYQVTMRAGSVDTVLSHNADQQIARIVRLAGGSSSVPTQAIRAALPIHPNPVQREMGSAITTIDLDHPSLLRLRLYNLSGTLVKSQDLGRLQSGRHEIRVDINDLPSGVYLMEISGGDGSMTSRLVVE